MKIILLTLLAIALVFATTAAFLWHENLNFDKALNHEKFANYATVLGAIGTTIAMIFLAMQLQEMEHGRRSTHRPLLVVQPCSFYTKDWVAPDNIMPVRPFFYLDGEFKQIIFPQVNILNIGKGVAKNVKVEWIYKTEELEKYIEKTEYNGNHFIGFSKCTIGYINEASSVDAFIAADFLICCGILLNNFSPKPSTILKLSYEDIHDTKVYTKRYVVEVSAVESLVMMQFKDIEA